MQSTNRPSARLGSYKGLAVARRPVQPQPAQLEEALRALRYRNAKWKPEDGPAARRDQLILDFAGYFSDGTPIPDSSSRNVLVVLGQGKMLPGVEERICGHRAGEVFRIPVTYPETFPMRSLAGREVEFEITLHEVRRRTMPDTDEAFAKAQGCKDLDELKEKIAAQQLDKNQRTENLRIEALLLAQAGAGLEMEFPRGYLARQAEQRVQKMEADLAAGGQNPQVYYRLTGHDRSWHLQRAALEIEADWRRRLAVELIAQQEGLSVTEAEIDAESARLKEKHPDQEVPRDTIGQVVLTRKVLEILKLHAVYSN